MNVDVGSVVHVEHKPGLKSREEFRESSNRIVSQKNLVALRCVILQNMKKERLETSGKFKEFLTEMKYSEDRDNEPLICRTFQITDWN